MLLLIPNSLTKLAHMTLAIIELYINVYLIIYMFTILIIYAIILIMVQ
jgi:hypothetical protein